MMLVLHDDVGRITQIMGEPIDPAYVETLRERGTPFVLLEDESDTAAIFAKAYVFGGRVVARPAFPGVIDKTSLRADGIDKAVISSLPQPCVLLIDAMPVERKAGTLTLTSDMPADYLVAADQWPFLPWSVTVSVR